MRRFVDKRLNTGKEVAFMARVYRIAADTSEKEKAVGGILTFAQAGWLILGLLIFAAIFVPLAQVLPPVIALFIGLVPGLGIGLPFAFYQKGGLTLSQYLMWRIKFNKKSKHMVNTMTYRIDRAKDYEREQAAKNAEQFS